MPDEWLRNNDSRKGRKVQLVGLNQFDEPNGVKIHFDSTGSGDKLESGCKPVAFIGYCKMSCNDCFIDREITTMIFMPGTLQILSSTNYTGCCPE